MKNNKVAVLGAGFVGVCTGISLIKRGFDVVIIDRLPPASETSYGNAGVIANMSFHPLANPKIIRELPKLLLNRDTRFLIKYTELPWLAPWLSQFLRNCDHNIFRENTAKLASICTDATIRHQKLISLAECTELLNDTGWLRVYRSQTMFARAQETAKDYDRFSTHYKVLDSQGIRELEPDLGFNYTGAIWMDETHSIRNPGLLCKKYFDYFLSQGGEYLQQSVDSVDPANQGWMVRCNQESTSYSKIVMALGVWSNQLLAPLGIKLPIAQERGYHMMFEAPEDRRLNRSVMDVEFGYVLSPLQTGIRVTTGANLVARERPPDSRQLQKLLPHIHKTFALGKPLLDKSWMGRRPSTPDSLPIIGPVDSQPGLFIATGHGHIGVTLSPITGELVADEICGQGNPLCKPFYPSRF